MHLQLSESGSGPGSGLGMDSEKLLFKEKMATQSQQYTIEKKDRPPPRLPLDSPLNLFLHILTWLLWTVYFTKRVQNVSGVVAEQGFSNETLRALALLLVEGIFMISETLTAAELSLSLLPSNVDTAIPEYRLVGTQAPTVDICITTCGEDVETIMDTAAAAAYQKYPYHAYRVFVLDDAKSPELKQAVQDFNSRRAGSNGIQTIYYLARDKKPGLPHYYKSGNLRYGLEESQRMENGSEYFAALDADMIVEPEWLCKTVPHLALHPEVALASPPQISYNIPNGDTIGQDSNVYAHILEPLRNRFNCSQCSGSGYVMSRKALDSIGGWPLANVGEDILCSYLLIGQGWRTVFIPDEMQFGLAPGSFDAYMMQRKRWTDGSLLLARMAGFYIPGLAQNFGFPLIPQALGFLHVLKTYSSLPAFIAVVLLPVCLFFDQGFVTPQATAHSDSTYLRAAFICVWFISKACTTRIYGPIGLKNLSNTNSNRLIIMPQNAMCVVRSMLPNWTIDFTVTGAFKSKANERSDTNRQSRSKRILNPLILSYAAYAIIASLVLTFIAFRAIFPGSRSPSTSRYAYTGLSLRLLSCAFSATVPVRYMYDPPTVPERRELLEQNQDGIYHSKRKGWIKRDRGYVTIKEVLELFFILALDWF